MTLNSEIGKEPRAESRYPRADVANPFSKRSRSHRASASPIGVEGGAFKKGHISAEIRCQLAVALRLPSTA